LAAAHRTPATALTPRQGIARLVAHRGSGHEFNDPSGPPENSAEAVDYGFANGADAVEVDVWVTADGVPVVHHDATTDRTTNWPGQQISELTYAQLDRVSAGAWKGPKWSQVRVPTLAQVAADVPSGRGLVVEIVEGPQAVEAVGATVAAAGLGADRAMFIAKNLDTAAAFKQARPEHTVLWIVDTTPRWQTGSWAQGHKRGPDNERHGFDEPADVGWLVEQVRTHGLDGLDTLFAYPPDLPAAISEARLKWLVWTANDPRAIDTCLADGAWGITTDNTADVRDWLVAAGMQTSAMAGLPFC
jgi:glycerophosphoryl diester phosphodiesterase